MNIFINIAQSYFAVQIHRHTYMYIYPPTNPSIQILDRMWNKNTVHIELVGGK